MVPTLVRVVRLDHDFWYAVAGADGALAAGETPHLDPEGRAYYVRFTPGWHQGTPFWPDSGGYLTLDEAKRHAESRVPAPVRWR